MARLVSPLLSRSQSWDGGNLGPQSGTYLFAIECINLMDAEISTKSDGCSASAMSPKGSFRLRSLAITLFLFRKQGLRPSKLLVERDSKVWKSTEAVILAWLGGLAVKELVLLLATVRFCFFAVRPVSPVDATPLPQSIPLLGAPLVTLRSCLSCLCSLRVTTVGTPGHHARRLLQASALVLFFEGTRLFSFVFAVAIALFIVSRHDLSPLMSLKSLEVTLIPLRAHSAGPQRLHARCPALLVKFQTHRYT